MSDFATLMESADDVVFAVLGAAATYIQAGGTQTSVTAVLNHGQELLAAGPGALSERITTAILRTTELSHDIARGEQLLVGTDTYLVERVVSRDPEGLTVALELKRT